MVWGWEIRCLCHSQGSRTPVSFRVGRLWVFERSLVIINLGRIRFPWSCSLCFLLRISLVFLFLLPYNHRSVLVPVLVGGHPTVQTKKLEESKELCG